MIRRLLGVSAIVLTAGLAVAGCAPVNIGAAAIVGNQGISVANLDTQAGKLASAANAYKVQITQQQITQVTLGRLILLQIGDRVAGSAGITVTPAQGQSELNSLLKQQEQSSGTSLTQDQLLTEIGFAPDLASELGRYLAIVNQYETSANGGTAPTSASSPAVTEFNHAQCLAAKSLNIKVNPQFGRLDYTDYAVVNGPDTVSRPSGPVTDSALKGLTPAC